MCGDVYKRQDEVTVVAEYTPEYRVKGQTYQSEAALEQSFIHQLESQGYEYIRIANEASMIENIRRQLEKLNDYTFTDGEWERFFNESLACLLYTSKKIKIRELDSVH